MAIGIETVGGGNNKFNKIVIHVEGEGSKGIFTKDSFGNEFIDVQFFSHDLKEKFKEIQSTVFNIQDDSINYETKNKYRDDVLSKLPILINADSEDTLKKNAFGLLTLLSSWITIKTELSIQLKPYTDYLISLLGG